jgi:hypothetical protein
MGQVGEYLPSKHKGPLLNSSIIKIKKKKKIQTKKPKN